MSVLAALAATMALAVGCVGWGALVLAAFRVHGAMNAGERLALSFVFGMGVVGWLVFPLGAAGWLAPAPLAGVTALGWAGLWWLRDVRPPELPVPGWEGGTLALVAVLVVAAYVVQGVVPPTDADSMAYHFANVKRFAAENRLVFVPRGADGAVPMLVHMTYQVAWALGGEQAMTLWTTLSGLMGAVCLYALARRHLAPSWAAALALVLVTTPAMVYGLSSGQVEPRTLQFVLAAGYALMRLSETGRVRWAALAGLAAGFYAGGKYIGLFLVAAGGLVSLLGPGWFRRGLAFGVAAVVAGCQWYLWNWACSGDPVFPLLHDRLGYPSALWNPDHNASFAEEFFTVERVVPANLAWFLRYPFQATLDGLPKWEAGRTGFGPVVLLLLPFALAGAWAGRRRLGKSPLLAPALVVALFYALWWFTGSAQRLRHLLPLYPLLLWLVGVAAVRLAERARLVWAVKLALASTLAFQMAVLAVFSLSAVRHVATGESRTAYLERSLSLVAAAWWVNDHLGPGQRIVLRERHFLYYLDVPYYYAHEDFQALVDVRRRTTDAGRFLAQLHREGITHVMAEVDTGEIGGIVAMTARLVEQGCARVVARVEGRNVATRTMPGTAPPLAVDMVELVPGACASAQQSR